jgi:hypothetical protein
MKSNGCYLNPSIDVGGRKSFWTQQGADNDLLLSAMLGN